MWTDDWEGNSTGSAKRTFRCRIIFENIKVASDSPTGISLQGRKERRHIGLFPRNYCIDEGILWHKIRVLELWSIVCSGGGVHSWEPAINQFNWSIGNDTGNSHLVLLPIGLLYNQENTSLCTCSCYSISPDNISEQLYVATLLVTISLSASRSST